MGNNYTMGLILLGVLAPQVATTAVFDEFRGIRSSAMGGAHRGVGTSNDSIILNPAGMAIKRRYNIDANFSFNKVDNLNKANLSIVDSTGPIAAGLAYTYSFGDNKISQIGLHYIYASMAYKLGNSFAVGLSTKNIRGEFYSNATKQSPSIYNADIGVLLVLNKNLFIGGTYHNVVKTNFKELTPPRIGIGGSYLWSRLVLAADLEIEMSNPNEKRYIYRAGGEWLYNKVAPIRIGYIRKPYAKEHENDSDENILTAGVGYTNKMGALDIAYQQSVERSRNWTIIGSIKFYLF